MTDLAHVHAALAAASTATDLKLRVLYVAAARAGVDQGRRDVDDAERLVVAHEAELVRLAAGSE